MECLVPALAARFFPGSPHHSLDKTGVLEGNWGNNCQHTHSRKLTEFFLKRSVPITWTRDFPGVIVFLLVPLHSDARARGKGGVNLATPWFPLAPIGESSNKMIPPVPNLFLILFLLSHASDHVHHGNMTRFGHQEHFLPFLLLVLNPFHIVQADKHARCRNRRGNRAFWPPVSGQAVACPGA